MQRAHGLLYNKIRIILFAVALLFVFLLISSCYTQNKSSCDEVFSLNFKNRNADDTILVYSLDVYQYENEDGAMYFLYEISYYSRNQDHKYDSLWFYENSSFLMDLPKNQMDVWKDYIPNMYSLYLEILDNGTYKSFSEEEINQMLDL